MMTAAVVVTTFSGRSAVFRAAGGRLMTAPRRRAAAMPRHSTSWRLATRWWMTTRTLLVPWWRLGLEGAPQVGGREVDSSHGPGTDARTVEVLTLVPG